ncbi:MAG: NAD-dependent epimerase/dehydratase family protein [Terrimonas sp.]|nr:NAD-dependent epimerase/dehydratase family protein [Terrimonas sp.]
MKAESKIYIAGHAGLAGKAISDCLQKEGYRHLVTRSSADLDLRNQQATANFFQEEKPEYVFLAAAKVGGILANTKYPGDFLYDNLMIQSNIIHQSFLHQVKKLVFIASSAIYPRAAPLPFREETMLTGIPEPSTEPYAIAKIAGIRLCESYRKQYGCNFFSVIPANLYGYTEKNSLDNAHVIPALLNKFHTAKVRGDQEIVVWGTGNPYREFLHVQDLASACIFLMQSKELPDRINIGTGEDIRIRDLVSMIREIVGYSEKVVWDHTKPDGADRKLLDVSKISAMGWKPEIRLKKGLEQMYRDHFEYINV